MEKLTLEQIAPYLPYGLKLYVIQKGSFLKSDNIEEVQDLDVFHDLQLPLARSRYKLISAKPILRPMDLTKPITIDGKEVIPIVELAKIEFKGENEWYYVNTNTVENKCGLVFEFDKSCFLCYDLNNDARHIFNQNALFKWLYANLFDVYGLIEKGLAIDVNSLETNPYNQ